jgi:signal transduction histidine kinase
VRLEAFANLAHELRTPLQVMLGYLDILCEEWADAFGEEPRRMLERMNINAHALAQTVENIMEFAVGDPGMQTQVEGDIGIETEIDLADLIAELRPTFEAANQGRLALEFDLSDAPVKVRSLRRPLRLIVQNLVLNALKFTAAGTVTVTARRKGRTHFPNIGESVEIEVRDTGPGISPEQMDLACEPFMQLSRSSVRRYRGMGLGLAVVRRNVAAIGGTFEAHSTSGVGSTFVIRIPGLRTQLRRWPAHDRGLEDAGH